MTDHFADTASLQSYTDSHKPAELIFAEHVCHSPGVDFQVNTGSLAEELEKDPRPIDQLLDEEMPNWDNDLDNSKDRDMFRSDFSNAQSDERPEEKMQVIDEIILDDNEPVNDKMEPNDTYSTKVSSNKFSPCRRRYRSPLDRMLIHQSSHREHNRNDGDCWHFSFSDREKVHEIHQDLFKDWKYSEEERVSLRHKVETLSKEHCMAYWILGNMLLTPEEMDRFGDTNPWPEDARQALLALSIGDHWSVFNLAILVMFAEKIKLEEHSAKQLERETIPFNVPHHSFWYENEFRNRFTVFLKRLLLEGS